MTLLVALGGIAFSLRKLLRPTRAPRLRVARTVPYARAISYAAVAALSLTGLLLVTQGSWIPTGRVRAGAPQQRTRPTRKPRLEPRDLYSASSSPSAVNVPQFSSAFQVGGKGVMQIGGTAVDRQGNTYVAGAFYGAVTFDTAGRPTTLTNTEDFDVFIAKYDPAHRPLWARAANGATGLTQVDPETGVEKHYSLDGALSVAVDAQGNAYVGGGFVKSLAFKDGGGNTVATLGDSNSEINFEAFVAKYDAAGALVWARGGGSGAAPDPEAEEDLDSGINGVTDIVVDKAGVPYVAGAVSGANFLGRAIAGNGQRDILLSRLDPATGNPVWVSTPGSAGIDAAEGLAIDDDANLYLIGAVGATITFPTQPQPTTLTVDDEFGDSFLAKYDQDGQTLWAKQIAGDQPIEGIHVAATGAGDVYLTGGFAVEATFDSITVADPSEYLVVSGFLAKYDTGGSAQWARIFGHYNNDGTEGFTFGYRVAVDNAQTPYVLGTFDNEVTFNVESPDAQQSLTSMGREDNFIAHYDAAGNYRWVKQLKESEDAHFNISDESVPVGAVPLRIVHNEANDSLTVTSDFLGTAALDNLTLDSGSDIHSYVAMLPLTPTVQFTASSYTVSEGAGSAQIIVTRVGDLSGASSVDYTTADGTAAQKGDYEFASGTLAFGPGETQKSFRVLVVDDGLVEGPETFNLTLSSAAGTAVGLTGVSTVTITDNDTTPSTTNPIDDTQFFVRQHYFDFLNREPDPSGFNFWVNNIESCGADSQCREVRRIDTSAAFFLSIEFQRTGYLAYLTRKASFGDIAGTPVPVRVRDFLRDTQSIGRGVVVGQGDWQGQLAANRQSYLLAFVQSGEFRARYPGMTAPAAFVNSLDANAGGVLTSTEKESYIKELSPNPADPALRASVLGKVASNQTFAAAQFNHAFVLMQYFGYLRRDPNAAPDANFDGYNFWLAKLDRFGGDYRRAEMVRAFISSTEYRQRFGS